MFTGLVETIGTVTALEPLDISTSGGGGTSLTISDAGEVLQNARLGDSICVNGTCLTITDLPSQPPASFKVGIAPETLRRSNLGALTQNSPVNLEASLLPGTRLGGHFLQGHVDTTANITRRRPDGNAVVFRLVPRDKSVLKYVVEKGYIALDGTSLTITEVDEEGFEIMLIAYTQEKVVLANKAVGEEVNVEVDMVGKYVEKSVAAYFGGASGVENAAMLEKMVGKMVQEHTNKLVM